MQDARRKFLLGLAILLLAGLLIGWIYGRPLAGLLVATTAALAWLVSRLLKLEKAVRSGDLESVRYGDGIVSLIVSHIDYLQQRGNKHKQRYRQLLKEIRKSTNALPDGAILLNADFEILRCNSAAARLVGFRRRKDRGQRADNLLRDPAFARYLHSDDHSDSIEIM
ncbi:MAG: DUF3329 domain-containing protein, partial [Gammaproteobacteria bacterium]|nr:DUF3329 domain-containing protein [Gammaproteobacteria bacterium]